MIAAVVIIALILLTLSRVNPGASGATKPGTGENQNTQPPAETGAAIFWQHKTVTGFECVGYCNNVRPGANGNVLHFVNSRIVDFTTEGGILNEPILEIDKFNLHQMEFQAMGGHVLYHLTADGILNGSSGRMLFPGKDALDSLAIRAKLIELLRTRHEQGADSNFWNWLATLPDQIVDWVKEFTTSGHVTFDGGKKLAAGAFTELRRSSNLYQVKGSKWATYWQASPWPVIVELNPQAFYAPALIGER